MYYIKLINSSFIGYLMIYKWPSPGKLNLFLYVIGRRLDNYHFLQTLFQFIDYGDNLEILVTNNGKIRLFTNKKVLLYDNLVVRAAKLLKSCCCSHKRNLGVDIFLEKLLPIGSGLGGASSNAATVLMVLNYQWKCYLKKDVLMNLALMLGADVPIFIYGYSSIAMGIGEILQLVFIPKKWYLIVIPPISISTAFVFNIMCKLHHNYSPYRSIKKLLSVPFSNDVECIVKKIYPEINTYFAYLSQYSFVQLTGTGSCIFSMFNTEFSARRIQNYLPFWMNSIVVRGINMSPLHKKLLKHTKIIF